MLLLLKPSLFLLTIFAGWGADSVASAEGGTNNHREWVELRVFGLHVQTGGLHDNWITSCWTADPN